MNDRLLIVEDSQVTAKVLELFLRGPVIQMGVHHFATSLQAAKDLLELSVDYHAILLDLEMSDSTGTEAVVALMPYGVPIIVLTFRGDLAAECLKAGASVYLQKGGAALELAKAIQDVRK